MKYKRKEDTKKTKIPSRHIDALHEAIDIISNVADSAVDSRYYKGLLKRMRSLREKLK